MPTAAIEVLKAVITAIATAVIAILARNPTNDNK